ncbi:hypothetical protein M9Y10_013421 [Tritrichomonas musculus]|uniref:Uncharacterized protein n=1 Tax=Tritrichomonas musculus TaxID=1915356 RepID=A0ABR2I850_9EUKA
MDIMNCPVPDVRTSTILSLNLPDSIRSEFHRDYWTYRIMFLPPSEKTKLCYFLSTGYRTKIPLIFQLLEDSDVDLNFEGPIGTSIPEELIIHNMNLDILAPQLYRRTDICSQIVYRCRRLKPGFFPPEQQSNPADEAEQRRRRLETYRLLRAHTMNSLNSYEQVQYVMLTMKKFLTQHEDEINQMTITSP